MDCSDHAPLRLVLNTEPWAVPRFRFERYWTKIEGFTDVVTTDWNAPVADADACRTMDSKLRTLARALRSWHATCVGDIRLHLAAAQVVIYELDLAQDSRTLSADELELRRDLKANSLGLASLERTMARQRARTRNLREGDACTKYFHLQAGHRRCKNFLLAISHHGQTFTEEEAKASVVFDFYNSLLGLPFQRQHRLDLDQLGLPRLDLHELVAPFSAEEVEHTVRQTPSDQAPGPDGFSGAFFKSAWAVVGSDVVHVFQAFWELDFRSFNLINEATMVLLHKTESPEGLRDYRPISLIHSVGKLIAKCLALRLAPFMP